jgi:hypothetical protein
VLAVLSLEPEVLSLALCLPLSEVLCLVSETQQTGLFLQLEQQSQVLLVDLVELPAVFSEVVPCRLPSPAHPAQFLELSSALPTEPSPPAQISSVFKHLFLESWA